MKIVVDISPDGEISIEDDHGEGADVAQSLEKALGKVTGRKRTCASKTKPAVQKIKQSNG